MVPPNQCFASTSLAQRLSLEPLGLVDVGARDGVFEAAQSYGLYISVLAFEPDNDSADHVAQQTRTEAYFSDFEVHPVGLADHDGEARFYRLTSATNDSLLAPNAALLKRYDMDKWCLVGEERVPVQRLDRLLFESGQERPRAGEFLKIDTQGSELEILRGARKTLRERTVAVFCEVSFAELYTGQGRFSEVESYLRDLDFAFYGFHHPRLRSKKNLQRAAYRGRERLIQADAVFFKDPLDHAATLAPRVCDTLILCATMLGYFEFAWELSAHLEADASEVSRVRDWIMAGSRIDQEAEIAAVRDLSDKIRREPNSAALFVGDFVDQRREDNDVAYAMAQWDRAPGD